MRQGCILGPLLFFWYVIEMVISKDDYCKFLVYADDSAILYSHGDCEIISKKIDKTLEYC